MYLQPNPKKDNTTMSLPAFNPDALPVSYSDFEQLRAEHKIYADKTALIFKFARQRASFFLSRPRRFGKSLLASTLKSLFEHGLQYFQGLAIENLWQDQTYKVLYLDFSDMSTISAEHFSYDLNDTLKAFALKYQIEIDFDSNIPPGSLLRQLILRKPFPDPLVLLIDEYDKQLINCMSDAGEFCAYRKIIYNFFDVVKSNFKKFRFVYITGISRFSNTSIFSAFNNLLDLSLDPKYAALTGFTEAELHRYFEEFLQNAASIRGQDYEQFMFDFRAYYDGYCFDENASVSLYNPWSVLLFLRRPDMGLQPYWSNSGFQTMVVEYFTRRAKDLSGNYSFAKLAGESSITRYELKKPAMLTEISETSLLFQTGYLSIKSADSTSLKLAPPNFELKNFLASLYLKDILHSPASDILADSFKAKLAGAFEHGDFEAVKVCYNLILNSSAPQSNLFESEIAVRDLLLVTLLVLGFFAAAECISAKGYADLSVQYARQRLVFEFKLCRDRQEQTLLKQALEQLREKRYGQVLPLLKTRRAAMIISRQEKQITLVQEAWD